MKNIVTIGRELLKDLLNKGEDLTLVETLPLASYEHAHIPGAINIPPDKIRQLASERLPDRDKRIVVYCSKPS